MQFRLATEAASRVTVPSHYMGRLAAKLGVTATTVPLGVSLERWPASPPRARQRGAPLRLLHVASLNRVKDQATLLRATAELRSRAVDFQLRIVGFDTLGGEIQQLAQRLGLSAHVEFADFRPHPALRQEYENADLLVVTSRHEAGPLVMLEAALAGVPTVGTCVGHIADHSPNA
jgi:glycosyltransferase involved in cell wall biosynthesis